MERRRVGERGSYSGESGVTRSVGDVKKKAIRIHPVERTTVIHIQGAGDK